MVMMVMVVVVWVWETFCLRLRPSLKSRSRSQAATLKSLKAHLTILQIRTADATDTKLRPFFVKQKVKDKLKMFFSFGLSINSLYFRVMTTQDDSVMSEKAKYKDKFLFITVLKQEDNHISSLSQASGYIVHAASSRIAKTRKFFSGRLSTQSQMIYIFSKCFNDIQQDNCRWIIDNQFRE